MVKTIKLRKNISKLFTILSIVVVTGFSAPLTAQEYHIKTVVLDAGHGGNDSGARGAAGSLEKNVTLSVVLLLGKKIEANYPDIKVIYTRKTDVFIPLYERASIANKNKADLFLSIHCNSSTSRTPYGTETFVLGQHKTEDQFDVAKRENSVIKLENNAEDMYDGFDPNSPEMNILWSLNLNAYLEQSMTLADKVQGQYSGQLNRMNRGVKQAGFVVLYRTTMPSILTEIGFLSNPTEERYLTSSNGQNEIAEALFQAFKAYKTTMESNKGVTPVAKNTIDESSDKDSSSNTSNSTNTQITDNNLKTGTNQGVSYKIQIAVTSQLLNIRQAPYNKLRGVTFERYNNLYKYLVGNTGNYSEASQELERVKNLGFKDAFIVVYKQGVRLSPNDAKIYLQ